HFAGGVIHAFGQEIIDFVAGMPPPRSRTCADLSASAIGGGRGGARQSLAIMTLFSILLAG
ncbi:hypothetical protein CKJ89_36855, partial [Klebsiella pneumoniae]